MHWRSQDPGRIGRHFSVGFNTIFGFYGFDFPFNIYIERDKANSFLMWFFLDICSAIGYKIKPQTFIMLIAIVLVETFDDVKRTELKSKRSANTECLQSIVI